MVMVATCNRAINTGRKKQHHVFLALLMTHSVTSWLLPNLLIVLTFSSFEKEYLVPLPTY